MRRLIRVGAIVLPLAGCGPPTALKEMHSAFNQDKWAVVTEKYADMGQPKDLDGISMVRVAYAAERVYQQSRSKAYLDLAIDSYELAAQKDPSLADAHYYRVGGLMLQASDENSGQAAFQNALGVNPVHVGAATRLVRMAIDAGQFERAAQVGQCLLQVKSPIDDTLRRGLLDLAMAEAKSKREQKAMDVLRHANRIGPRDWEPDIRYGLAQVYNGLGENGKARAAMRKALAELPDSSKDRPRFEKFLEKLELESRGQVAAGSPSPSPTATTPTPAPAPTPTSAPADAPMPVADHPAPAAEDSVAKATALAAQAAGLADQNKLEEAIRLLEEAVRLAPKLPAPPAQLAMLHVKAANRPAAIAVLKTAIQNIPDNELLKKMLERLQAAQ